MLSNNIKININISTLLLEAHFLMLIFFLFSLNIYLFICFQYILTTVPPPSTPSSNPHLTSSSILVHTSSILTP